ncbi:TRIM2 [Branchiostoma lanceolatum]|uniref:TRIM2 protein n=1 Tax=Branchiostoma lanceolatum TaxID=7740 RepID=A0A8J9VBA9_BRALA|nr:TRIM2 [Branchiostoma lanceolatum]
MAQAGLTTPQLALPVVGMDNRRRQDVDSAYRMTGVKLPRVVDDRVFLVKRGTQQRTGGKQGKVPLPSDPGTKNRKASFSKVLKPLRLSDSRNSDAEVKPVRFGHWGSAEGQLKRPRGVAVTSSGQIYVVDAGSEQIQVFSPEGEFIRRFLTGRGNARSDPWGIAVFHHGILVTDAEESVVNVFRKSGHYVGQFGKGILHRPCGIAVDPKTDTIFVTDRECVKVFRGENGVLMNMLYFYGCANPYGSYVDFKYPLPYHVAVDKGNAVVSDWREHCVKVFDIENGVLIKRIGARGARVGGLEHPRGVCLDRAGNVIVADHGNKRVQLFDCRKGYGFGRYVATEADGVRSPEDVALVPDGRFALTDSDRHSVTLIGTGLGTTTRSLDHLFYNASSRERSANHFVSDSGPEISERDEIDLD